MIESVAAFAAWLGASTIVLADGRLGLAAGMALTTIALSVVAWQSAGIVEAIAILAGGGFATGLRLMSGPPRWNVMPPGSTPRLVLCVGAGLLALWIAATVIQGSGIALRFAVMTAIALPTARILATDDIAAATTACGAMLLAVAAAAALLDSSPGPVPYVLAAVACAGAAVWPRRERRAT